jgi:tetratricopeptide (TPR) repeat protein
MFTRFILLTATVMVCIFISGCGTLGRDYHLRLWERAELKGYRAKQSGDYAAAERFYKIALAEGKELSRSDIHIPISLHDLGDTFELEGNHKLAQSSYSAAISLLQNPRSKQNTFDENVQSLELLQCEVGLAKALFALGDLQQSEHQYQLALSYGNELCSSKTAGKIEAQIAQCMSDALTNLSQILAKQKQFNEACDACSKALKLSRQSLCPDDTVVAILRQHLALLASSGKATEARTLQREMQFRQIKTKLDDKNLTNNSDPEQFYQAGRMAEAVLHNGDAERYYALSIANAVRIDDIEDQIKSALALGNIYERRGDIRKAMDIYSRALTIARQSGPDSQLLAARCLESMGSAHDTEGNCREAADCYSEEFKILRKALPPEQLYATKAAFRLQELHDLIDPAQVDELLQNRLASEVKEFGPNSPELLDTLKQIAVEYGHRKDKIRQRMLSIAEKSASQTPWYPKLLIMQGEKRHSEGLHTESEQIDRQALIACRKTLPQNDKMTLYVLLRLSQLCRMTREFGESRSFLSEARQIAGDLATNLKDFSQSNYYFSDPALKNAALRIPQVQSKPTLSEQESSTRRSLEQQEKSYGKDSSKLLEDLDKLAQIYSLLEMQIHDQRLTICERGAAQPLTFVWALVDSAEDRYSQADFNEAERLFKHAHDLCYKYLPPTDTARHHSSVRLVQFYESRGKFEKAKPYNEELRRLPQAR